MIIRYVLPLFGVRFTLKEAHAVLLGFPAKNVTLNWDGTLLFHTSEHYVARGVREKLERMTGFDLATASVLPICCAFAGGLLSVHLFGTFFAFVLGFWLGFEVWSAVCALVVRSDVSLPMFSHQRRNIKQILEDDHCDFQLAGDIEKALHECAHALCVEDIAPHPADAIPAPSDSEGWRVRAVQYHLPRDGSLLGRDVTIAFAAGEDAKDGLVAVVPSQETVAHWLSRMLRGAVCTIESNTHCSATLEKADVIRLLKNVWKPAEGVMKRIADLDATTAPPFESRSTVTVFGARQGDGSVLLEAVQSERISVTIAPLAAAVVFAHKLEELFEQHAGNPALRAPAARD